MEVELLNTTVIGMCSFTHILGIKFILYVYLKYYKIMYIPHNASAA